MVLTQPGGRGRNSAQLTLDHPALQDADHPLARALREVLALPEPALAADLRALYERTCRNCMPGLLCFHHELLVELEYEDGTGGDNATVLLRAPGD